MELRLLNIFNYKTPHYHQKKRMNLYIHPLCYYMQERVITIILS